MKRIDILDKNREVGLAAIGGLAAAAFAALASQVVRPRTALQDLRMRTHIPSYGRKQKKAAVQFGYLGKEWAVLPLAAVVGGKLWTDDRKEGGAAIVTATLAAIAASHVFDVTLPQRTPPPGRKAPLDPHFPSGHALHSGSLLLTSAYVLAREGISEAGIMTAASVAIGAALGFDRLVQDRHWTSDIVGGWLAAIAISATTVAAYEAKRPKTMAKGNASNRSPRRRSRAAARKAS